MIYSESIGFCFTILKHFQKNFAKEFTQLMEVSWFIYTKFNMYKLEVLVEHNIFYHTEGDLGILIDLT